MNVLQKLTLRHLKLNKKRTLVTIVGVVISVAMITAVATFGTSLLDMLIRGEVLDSGNWHVRYEGVSPANVQVIKDDRETKSAALSRDIGYASLPDGKNEYKPYLFIREYDERGLQSFPIYLKEGRLPQNEDEIVLPAHLEENGGVKWKTGDTVTLQMGKRVAADESGAGDSYELGQNNSFTEAETFVPEGTRTYRVVGIMARPGFEKNWSPGYTAISLLGENNLGTAPVSVWVELKNPGSGLRAHAYELAEKMGMQGESVPEYDANGNETSGRRTVYYTVSFHENLLCYYFGADEDGNQFFQVLYTLCGLVLAIIVLGSVSLIYNAFSISISERSRHLGMLASVGATRRQKRSSVFFEGTVIGLISIPVGILAGIGGIAVTFAAVNPIFQGLLSREAADQLAFRTVVSPLGVLAAVLLSILTIALSLWIPARRASRVTPIEAIRQTQDVKLKGKTVRTSRLTRRIFGFEAELALKNLKRNRRRYRSTIVSLVISILLFLSVSAFTSVSAYSARMMDRETVDYDISVSFSSSEIENAAQEKAMKSILQLSGVQEASQQRRINTEVFVPEAYANDYAKEQSDLSSEYRADAVPEGTVVYNLRLISMDDASFAEFAKNAGVSKDDFSDRPWGIAVKNTRFQADGSFMETEVLPGFPKGGTLASASTASGAPAEIEVAGWSNGEAMGLSTFYTADQITVVASEEMFRAYLSQWGEEERPHESAGIYLRTDTPDAVEKAIAEIKEADPTSFERSVVVNTVSNRQKEEQLNFLILVFVYGFIVLITAICVANIFNTISTSVTLRRREFAMLKSVGMTPRGFGRMINYESVFYGLKALAYGLPLSLLVTWLFYRLAGRSFVMPFWSIFPWKAFLITAVGVFLVVGVTMLYSSSKIKKQNIIDSLKEENI